MAVTPQNTCCSLFGAGKRPPGQAAPGLLGRTEVSFHLEAEKACDAQATAQHHVFGWLNWAPPPTSPCYKALHRHFPGALPGRAVHARSRMALSDGSPGLGCTPENTIFGLSICPDEINYERGDIAHLMAAHWGKMFPLGGISGAPFSGKTGFKAFSHHAPDNGNVLVLFGPHVAISETGEVGRYHRRGQHEHSAACGAVIGAYNSCIDGHVVDEEFDETDMQMAWIKKQLAPHAARIQRDENPMVALAREAYEMVKAKVLKVVNTDFGSGKLVLLGGIQINMPAPYCDHFLPLLFEAHQGGEPALDLLQCFRCPLTQRSMRVPAKLALNEDETKWVRQCTIETRTSGASSFNLEDERAKDTRASAQHHVFSWLAWAPPPESACYRSLHRHFPGALPSQVVHARSSSLLTNKTFGCTPENTLFGLSICPDEINYDTGSLAQLMKDFWGEMFPLGGIGGAPFSGKTGFSAFSHHVPCDGNVLVLFGPHVAISEAGEVGRCLRQGQACGSAACGAVIGAYHSCTGKDESAKEEFDETDMQMAWIKKQLAPHVARISQDESPMAALAHQAYEMVRDKVLKVVNNDFGTGKLVLIGGIQINMPAPHEDHFLPCMFEVRDGSESAEDLLPTFSCSLTQNKRWGNV